MDPSHTPVEGVVLEKGPRATIREGFPYNLYDVHRDELTDDERRLAAALSSALNRSAHTDEWGPLLPTSLSRTFPGAFKTRILSLSDSMELVEKLPREEDYALLAQKLSEILTEFKAPVRNMQGFVTRVLDDGIGYGVLGEPMRDPELEEVMVNGATRNVFVYHRKHGMCKTDISIAAHDSGLVRLLSKAAKFAGRGFGDREPLLDARMPDGSRLNATFETVTPFGHSLTIRKYMAENLSMVELIAKGTLSTELAAFLWLMVEGMNVQPMNVIVTGGSGCGKTTLLNALSTVIRYRERIITIEDTTELQFTGRENWVSMESRPSIGSTQGVSMNDLLTNAMRMRPDRIIVGEVRGEEAQTLFVAMDTGHQGCLTGDSQLALLNGVEEIGSFVDRHMACEQIEKNGEWEVCGVKNEEINSLNNEGKIFPSKIVKAWRRPYSGQVLHIRFSSGNYITCTPDHPLYSFAEKITALPAEKLVEGQWIISPRKLLRNKTAVEPEIEYWSGLLYGDGHILDHQRIRKKNGKEYICNEGRVSLFIDDPNICQSFSQFMKDKLDNTYVGMYLPHPKKNCYIAEVSGYSKSKTIQQLLSIPSGSRQMGSIAKAHFTCEVRSFVAGFFDAEGSVNLKSGGLIISNANEKYIDFIKYALLTDGIIARKYTNTRENSTWFDLIIYDKSQIRSFNELYPIRHQEKIQKIKTLLSKNLNENPNVDVIPCNTTIHRLIIECKRKGISEREIARKAGITHGILGYYKRNERHPTNKTIRKLIRTFKELSLDVSSLEEMANSDVFWDRITSIESTPYNGFVYDLTLNDSNPEIKVPHNFVAQGIFVGNCIGTLHSNTAREMLVRLTAEPMSVPQALVHLLNLVVVLQKVYDPREGMKRRVMQVAEITHLDQNVLLSNLYERNPDTDVILRTDTPSHTLQELADISGKSKTRAMQELEVREKILEWMLKHNIRSAGDVEKIIQQYYFDPQSVLELVNKDL